MTPTDQLLAQRAAAGDAAAFASLHDRHAAAVRRTALGILRDADAAGDVVQATFARAWSALGRGQVPAEPRAWLHAIARNAALDELRARRRVGPAGDAQALDGVAEQGGHGDPEAALRMNELSSLLWEAATQLSASERELLELHVRRGLDAEALAGRLGLRVGAMHTRLSRLRATLREAIVANVLVANGQPACPVLAALVTRPELQRDPRERRRSIGLHADDCERCRAATRPSAILAGLLPFQVADAWAAARRALAARERVRRRAVGLALALAFLLVACAAVAAGLDAPGTPPTVTATRAATVDRAVPASEPVRRRAPARRTRRRHHPPLAPARPRASFTPAAVPPMSKTTRRRAAASRRAVASRRPRRLVARSRTAHRSGGLPRRTPAPRSAPVLTATPAPPEPAAPSPSPTPGPTATPTATPPPPSPPHPPHPPGP